MLEVAVSDLWLPAEVLQGAGEMIFVNSPRLLLHVQGDHHDTQGKLVGRYPLLFLVLPLIVTGLCCSGFAT